MHRGSVAQLIADFHRGGFLPFDAERIDGIDELDMMLRRQCFHDRERLVEVSVDLNDRGLMHHRLRQLAHRNLSRRNQHVDGQAGSGAISRGRSGGIARGGAHNRTGAVLDGL